MAGTSLSKAKKDIFFVALCIVATQAGGLPFGDQCSGQILYWRYGAYRQVNTPAISYRRQRKSHIRVMPDL